MELKNVKIMPSEQIAALEELIRQGIVTLTMPVMDETTAEALKALLEDLVDLVGGKPVTLSAQDEKVVISVSIRATTTTTTTTTPAASASTTSAATTTTTTTPAASATTLNPSVVKKLPDGYIPLDKVEKTKRRLSATLYVGNEKHGLWELYLADAELGIVQDANGNRASLRDAVRQWISKANLNLTTFNQFQYAYALASDQLP